MAEVRAFLATMAAQGYSTSTIRCTRGVLRLALRRAQEDDRLVRNVADLAEVPTGKRRQGGSMSREQMNALLGLDLDAWWRAYLTTAFTTGMRVGELLALSWDDVDFDAGVIRVRHSLKREHGTLLIGDLKTQSSKRTMQMPAAVAAARLAAPDWQDCGLVFCSPRNGRPKWHSLVDGTFKRLCEQAGIGGLAATGDPAQLRLDPQPRRGQHRGHRGRGRARQLQRDPRRLPSPARGHDHHGRRGLE